MISGGSDARHRSDAFLADERPCGSRQNIFIFLKTVGPGLFVSSIPPNTAASSSIFKLSRHPCGALARNSFSLSPQCKSFAHSKTRL